MVQGADSTQLKEMVRRNKTESRGPWGTESTWLAKAERRHQADCDSDCPGGPLVKKSPVNAGDIDSMPHVGRFHMPRAN